jgi:hypothetical protein
MGDVDMIDVVCFCGNSYSFIGDAGACPHCGERATFTRAASNQAGARSGEVEDVASRVLDEEHSEDMAA